MLQMLYLYYIIYLKIKTLIFNKEANILPE